MRYTVYHLVGIKFGCTKNPKKRFAENRRKYGKDIKIEIVEEFDDLEEATAFEDECNTTSNYKRDSRLYKDVKQMHKERVYKPLSESMKSRISKSMIGKNTGSHTEEACKKIGEATRNRPLYPCPYCDKQCKGKGNLNQHIKAKHKNV